jgi:hypothetical protein
MMSYSPDTAVAYYPEPPRGATSVGVSPSQGTVKDEIFQRIENLRGELGVISELTNQINMLTEPYRQYPSDCVEPSGENKKIRCQSPLADIVEKMSEHANDIIRSLRYTISTL